MKPFWRDEPLNEAESALLTAVMEAHELAADRTSISTMAVIGSATGSNSYCAAIASGLLALGGLHAPLVQTCAMLALPDDELKDYCGRMLSTGRRVPGFGSSFVVGADLDWMQAEALLEQHWPHLFRKMIVAMKALHDAGKKVYPNPALYTAAAALALGIPHAVSPFLFLAGRLKTWSKIFMEREQSGITPT